jgi:RNA polymerase-binding transcription factor DksA
MNAIQNERYRQRLLRMKYDLERRRSILVGAMQQHESPPGEHERNVVPSMSMDGELATEHAEEEISQHVAEALDRIAEGNYGLCKSCGQKIVRARLDAIPYAIYCVACEMELEAESPFTASRPSAGL